MDEDTYTSDNQVNKVAWNPMTGCLATGHEDRNIRFFDLGSGELINSVIAHTDAVTGLSFSSNKYYLASVGHDGSIRTWDTRKFQCVHEIPVSIL
jgi:FOG: WD40 repeat